MNKSKTIIVTLLILTSSTIAFQKLVFPIIQENAEIYKNINVLEEELAKYPVDQLIINIKSGRWHLLNEAFIDDKIADHFFESFNMSTSNKEIVKGGIFEKLYFTYSINSISPLEGRNSKGKYKIELLISQLAGNIEPVKVTFQTQ